MNIVHPDQGDIVQIDRSPDRRFSRQTTVTSGLLGLADLLDEMTIEINHVRTLAGDPDPAWVIAGLRDVAYARRRILRHATSL